DGIRDWSVTGVQTCALPIWELEVDWHSDEAGAHDAVVRREELGAVGREDRDPVAALEAARQQGARDAVRHLVEGAIAELARALRSEERRVGKESRAGWARGQ